MRAVASAPVAELQRTYPWMREMSPEMRDECVVHLRELAQRGDFPALASAMLTYAQEHPVPSLYSDDGELLIEPRG